ncbi:hypothetical protein HDU79_000540, partial [Rhizoclosmatium sp. JEL0117]
AALKIEATGIEPIPAYARTQSNIIENFTFWASCNTVIPTFALGTLAINVFYMGFWDAVATIFFFNLMSSLCVALFSSMGPKLGLRQMILTRYSFGWYGSILISLINIVISVGWSTVNVVVGGQVLNGINGGALPVWAGVVIIAVLTTFLAVWGYHYIHKYDKFAFLPIAISFIICFGVSVGQWDTSAPALSTPVASILSFGGAIFGFGAGWTTMAADYSVFQPADSTTWKVFVYTFLGNIIPLTLTEVMGVGVASAAKMHKPQWEAENGGAILSKVLLDTCGQGFGSFLLVLLSLSIIAGNIPNDYSRGLSLQLIGKLFSKVPRAVWTFLGAILYIVLAILSIDKFNTVLENFLLVVGYFQAPYIAILVTEHFFFKKGDFSQYNIEHWDSPRLLPLGAAAVVSLAIGLVGAFLGMAEVYYTGVVALAISKPFGGDVGFPMAFGFALVSYLVLRSLEKSRTGI